MADTEGGPTEQTTTAASIFTHVHRLFRVLKPYLIGLAAVLITYLLFGWLALPTILQSQAEKYILDHSGDRLTMDRPSFNPILLDLRLKNLHLTEPDGEPLLSFEHLLIDFSAVSMFRRAYVFNEIRLEGLRASLELLPDGQLNWSGLIESLQGKEETSAEQKPSAPPRLIIRKLSLADGRIDLADRRTDPEWSASVVPLDVELTELSTLPNETGKYEVTAKTDFGTGIQWDGQIALNPFSIAGSLHIDEFPLAKIAAFAPMPPALAAPEGMASVSTQYQAGMMTNAFDVRLDDLSIGIDSFHVQSKTDPNASLSLGRVDLKGGQFDLLDRRIAIDTIAASGGEIKAERTAAGRINLLDLMPAEKNVAAREAATASATGANDWRYRIEHVTLGGFGAGFRDRTMDPAADLALQDVSAEVGGVSEDMATPLPVHLAFRSRDGGTFSAAGKVVPADASADLRIKLDDLAIKPAQPYLGHWTTLMLVDGTLSTEGHATYGADGGQYNGSAALQNLRIVEGDEKRPFLAWKSFGTSTLTVTPKGMEIDDLVLDGLDTRLIIGEDKSVNLAKIVRHQSSEDQPSASQPQMASSPFEVNVGRLQIQNSQLEYADRSLTLPFGTHIHALSGTIANISSKQSGTPAQLKLAGQVDNYGTARAEGRLDLFEPTSLLDIMVAFNNVEMTTLTPYSATFAGRRINSGKLSLNVHYEIKNRQLTGSNRVIMDKLTLGDRVKSPEAVDLPLDLAIAILEDSKGRIDLGLPVTGNLDDPQFSYGRIIWDAFTNVVTKIVTSPFRALGALFGGGEDFHGFAFEPGQPVLSPSEREKLMDFAGALNQRPNLSVTVHGTWANADRIALQDLALRQQLAGKLGLSTNGDPGPITTDQPKVRSALEGLYADHFGSGALAGLKEGYRKANPGELPETTGGQVMSALTGLLGTKSSLSDQDVEALKGTDFYALLYQRLRDAEVMPDTRMQALAQTRGEEIIKALREANAPLDRISLQATEKVDAGDDGIPLKMEMASVRK
jgi:uncharacterized protein involved in outer membrane biogenesis